MANWSWRWDGNIEPRVLRSAVTAPLDAMASATTTAMWWRMVMRFNSVFQYANGACVLYIIVYVVICTTCYI